MSSDSKGKAYKFCSLYTFVKKHNPELFELLDDMCASGLFRPKYPTTFIMPNAAMTKKLSGLVGEGDIDTAFEHLQKLFIYGKHAALDGDLVTYNLKKVKSTLSSLKPSSHWKSWDRKDNVAVFDAKDFPEEGDATQRPKTNKAGGADHECSLREEVTKKIMSSKEPWAKKMHTIAYHLNSLLTVLEKEDSEAFDKACQVMDPNMVVSWYILIRPSAGQSAQKYISNTVFEQWERMHDDAIKSVALLKKCFSLDTMDKVKLATNAQKRKEVLGTEGFEQTINAAMGCYDDKEALLEDELRFRFSDAQEFTDFHIHELNSVNWEDPESALVIFAKPSNSCLYKSSIHKLVKEFAKTDSFLYTRHTAAVMDKLAKNITGAGDKKLIKVLGSKAKKILNSMSDAEEERLAKMVKGLTKQQLDTLKKLIKA